MICREKSANFDEVMENQSHHRATEPRCFALFHDCFLLKITQEFAHTDSALTNPQAVGVAGAALKHRPDGKSA